MQTVSPTTLTNLRGDIYGEVEITVSPTVGVDFTLTNVNIIAGSFSIDRNSSSSETIEIGNSETSQLKVTLSNYENEITQKLEGAELYVELTYGTESFSAGYYIVDEVINQVATIEITALDFMAKFNKVYVAPVSESDTLYAILSYCCTQCGVSIETLSFNGSTTTVNYPLESELDKLTYHEIISFIAEFAGCNAFIDYAGKLNIGWYGDFTVSADIMILTEADRFNNDIFENELSITGVIFDSENESYIIGTEDYAVNITGNPFITTDNVTATLNSIYTNISSTAFIPFEFETHGFPHLWQMDLIKILSPDSILYNTIIMSHKYTLNGTSTLSCRSESETKSGYASVAPFTVKQRNIIKVISGTITDNKISTSEQASFIFNKLMSNSMGYFETIMDDPTTGAQTRYIHDNVDIYSSTNIYKQTEAGFAFSTTGNFPDTTWTSGMTADGNILAKVLTVIGVNADWINAGTIDAEYVTVGASTTFEGSEVYTWNEYLGLTWNEVIALGT